VLKAGDHPVPLLPRLATGKIRLGPAPTTTWRFDSRYGTIRHRQILALDWFKQLNLNALTGFAGNFS